MKTHNYAHQASREWAKRNDALDEFEYWGTPEHLIERGVLVRKPKRNSSGHNWVLIHGDLWFLFTSDGVQDAGPFDTKSDALAYVGEESASYVDTGIYQLSDDRYVARREVAIQHNFEVHPPAEVTNG